MFGSHALYGQANAISRENSKAFQVFKCHWLIAKVHSHGSRVLGQHGGAFHSTSALYRFSKKLKALKPLIRELGRDGLGNLTKRTKEAYELLCEKQKKTLQDPSGIAVQNEARAYEEWLKVANLEEVFLK